MNDPTMPEPPPFEPNVALARLTTFEVGGPARWLVRCGSVGELQGVFSWAAAEGLEVLILGGGSNLLVADAGFDGVVVQLTGGGVELERADGWVRVRAEAGVVWDRLVERAVEEGLAGLECLSGIPGRVGAAPIQNVGAYGQEVAETIESVEVVERATGAVATLAAADCGFSYRHSHFKTRWRERFAVTAVRFRLERRREAVVRYPELARRLGLERSDSPRPSLETVRREVLAVRREKSMLLDPGDPNRRSAGSFFLNPIVSAEQAEQIHRRASELAGAEVAMPVFPAAGGVKLSAAWLIERAGFTRGQSLGRAAISTRHALALVNRGGASAAEIVALAGLVRRGVRSALGVALEPEPQLVGFGVSADELLETAG